MKKRLFIIMLSIILALGIVGTVALTYTTNTTIEGHGNFFVTGESYPTKIQITGYNSRDKILYLNYDLHTTKMIVGDATFFYYVEVYDNDGLLIGNVGDYANPIELEGNGSSVSVSNEEIILADDLPIVHRIIISVKHVD